MLKNLPPPIPLSLTIKFRDIFNKVSVTGVPQIQDIKR